MWHSWDEYVRAPERGRVKVLGDFNYDPRRSGAETQVGREVRLCVEEMRLQDVSYNGAPGWLHYPAPEGSTPSRIDVVYADPRWVRGVTAGYMVGPEEMRQTKGYCSTMVTVEVNLGVPREDEDEEQESDEEGVGLPMLVRWPEEEEDDNFKQWFHSTWSDDQLRKDTHPKERTIESRRRRS